MKFGLVPTTESTVRAADMSGPMIATGRAATDG
jgi:hypothetical protein